MLTECKAIKLRFLIIFLSIFLIRKLVSLLLVVFLSASSAQTVDLECLFTVENTFYTCQLYQIEATDPNVQYNFVGEHLPNHDNNDVVFVEILSSNTPFIIPEIFSTFPNILRLDVRRSNLQSIEFPSDVPETLEQIFFIDNEIPTIESGTFSPLVNATLIDLINNHIQVIEEDAFAGLTRMERLYLIGNRLSELPGRIFANMPELVYLDLENNDLSRIESETFAENHRLRTIYLEYNQITAIAPNFIRNLSQELSFINLNGNECISSSFNFQDEFDIIRFHRALEDCYEAFSPRAPTDDRLLTMEFIGQLNVYDEFGNIIAVINPITDDGNSTTPTVPDTTTEANNGTTIEELTTTDVVDETTTEENEITIET